MSKELVIVKSNIIAAETLNRFTSYLDVAPLTVRSYISGLKMFNQYLSANGVKNPTRDNVIAFKKELEGKGRKPATIALYLSSLKRFFSWTESEGIYQNIAAGVKAPKQARDHKKDYFAGTQVKSILSGIDRTSIEGLRNYAMIGLITTCGLRTIEVVRANMDDLRTLGGVPVLYVQGKGRNSKTDFVKLTPQIEHSLREYFQARGKVASNEPLFASVSKRNYGQALTTRTVSGVCKNAMINAGFNSNRLTAHSLRHTAVTLALLSGQSLTDVQAFARHCNINTTMIYNHSVNRINSHCEFSIANLIF